MTGFTIQDNQRIKCDCIRIQEVRVGPKTTYQRYAVILESGEQIAVDNFMEVQK